jgi:hypothetical protein
MMLRMHFAYDHSFRPLKRIVRDIGIIKKEEPAGII